MEAMKATKGVDRKRGGERRKLVSKLVKTGLQFLIGRIACFLEKGRYAQRTSTGIPIYLTVVFEYLVIELIDVVTAYLYEDLDTEIFAIVVVYVDDMNLIGILAKLEEIAVHLKLEFEMKELGKT
ncbi:histone H2A.1-like [Pyrus x bretschneideri]|uniref:histone H2A.1-like n=1 Tax=Pyrus x bretschneideri TaxID=225117 RepID=UPI00202EDBDA|nr:histone H2A.1-like [Pyrus x bretschneideri]